MITTVFQKFLRTICLTHEKRSSNDWSQLLVWPEMDQKSSMAFSSHPELLACDITCLTITRHITDSWQNERKLRYMPMIDLVQFSNSISRRSWHFLCNVCYDPNTVLLNVRHGFILGGCSSSACSIILFIAIKSRNRRKAVTCLPWQPSWTNDFATRYWIRNSRDSLQLKRRIRVRIISWFIQPNTKMWPILWLGLSRQTRCGHRWFDCLKLLHDVFLLMPYIIIDSNVLCIGFMNCEKNDRVHISR